MRILVENRRLIENADVTYLTAAAAAAGTTLTVKAIDTFNSSIWQNNQYVIVGEIGARNAELVQINGTIAEGTSITIDNHGAGGLRFAHVVNEPVYLVGFNEIYYERATTVDGAKSVLATEEIQPHRLESFYDDLSNTTGFAFVRFHSDGSGQFSSYSDAIPYTGQSQRSLGKMVRKVRSLLSEFETDFISDDEITDALNDKQRDILNERMWTFNEIERSDSTVANQFAYDIDSEIKTLHSVRVRTIPLVRIGQARWEMFHWKTDQSSTTQSHVAIFDEQYKLYPRPSAAAASTPLNGAITAAATSLIVDDASELERGDFYRMKINDEVIYATSLSSNTFSGLLRGREGTTAAAHSDNDTVTELDIVATGQATPVDLENQNDETVIPEPIILCYGVAADLCYGKLNKEPLGDRYTAKFDAGLNNLKDRFTKKLTSQFARVKSSGEIVSDDGVIPDPNDYPTNVTAV